MFCYARLIILVLCVCFRDMPVSICNVAEKDFELEPLISLCGFGN